jgi:hypothetical protein
MAVFSYCSIDDDDDVMTKVEGRRSPDPAPPPLLRAASAPAPPPPFENDRNWSSKNRLHADVAVARAAATKRQ